MLLLINSINYNYSEHELQVEDGEEFEIEKGYTGAILVELDCSSREDYWENPKVDNNEFDLYGLIDELRNCRDYWNFSLNSLINHQFDIKIAISDTFEYYWGNPEEVNSMEFDPYGPVINLKAGKYKLEGNIIHVIKGDDD
jgi:hypothetical protein